MLHIKNNKSLHNITMSIDAENPKPYNTQFKT